MKNRKTEAVSLACTIAVLAVWYAFIGCPIRALTGIPCLGCGMTRAWCSVLTLHPARAFYFHPLWPLPPIFLALYFFVRPRWRRAYRYASCLMALLFVAVYLLRIFFHSPVLTIAPESGALCRIASLLLR